MVEDGHLVTLAQLRTSGAVAFGDGYRTRVDQLDGEGIPILRVADVGDASITPSFKDRVASSHRSRMGTKTSRMGDVLVTTKGTVGRIARVPADFPEHIYSPQLCYIRALEPKTIDPLWIYYCFRAPQVQHQLGVYKDQTDMAPYISLTDLQRVELPVPPVSEQRRIAGVLGAFDDLIDANLQLRQRLHDLGKSVYLKAAAAESTTVRLAEAVEFHNRARVPLSKDQRMSMPGPYPYYGATGQMDSVGKYLFDGVHILVGEDGSVVNDDGSPVVQMVWGRYWVNNHAHVLSGRGISDGLLRQALETSNVTPYVTGAVQPKLSMGRLRELRVSIPRDQTVSKRVDELAWAERELMDEISSLGSVRDELLPLLMSGRITVDEAWEAIP